MTKTSLVFSFMLVATGLLGACFNTKDIQSGGLKCAPSSDPNSPGVCPDGFFCGEAHLCFRNGTEGAALCQANEAQAPFGPFSACTPPHQSVSLCDPVCQQGCSCTHRCQMAGNADDGYFFTCQAPPAGALLDDFQPCDVKNDLCKPGRICLDPPKDSTGCGAQCLRFCRLDTDCPAGSRCASKIELANGEDTVAICSPPAVACNPVQAGAAPACANSLSGNSCYMFSTTYPDETMCDCAGLNTAGAACKGQHSCEPGYECVGHICKKLCLLAANGLGCAGAQTCVPYSSSTRFGTCQ